MRAEFDALIAEYRRDLPQKLARIESLLSGGRLAELRRASCTPSPARRAPSGCRSVGQAAAAAEAYLEASADALDAAGRAELERLVARLADEVRSATGGMKVTAVDTCVLTVPTPKPMALQYPQHKLVVAQIAPTRGSAAWATAWCSAAAAPRRCMPTWKRGSSPR